MTRKGHLSDVSDDAWAFVAPYLKLMRGDAPQREHPLREVFRGLRDRARLPFSRGWRTWALVPVALALYVPLTQLGFLVKALATVPGSIPPAWWPLQLNPTVGITVPEDLRKSSTGEKGKQE